MNLLWTVKLFGLLFWIIITENVNRENTFLVKVVVNLYHKISSPIPKCKYFRSYVYIYIRSSYLPETLNICTFDAESINR